MRLTNSLLFLFLLCALPFAQAQEDFRKVAPAPGPAPKIELGKYDYSKLPNGLQVIVVENHKLPVVSFQLFVDVPPHLEGEKSGIADLTGDLLKMGTTTRSKADIDNAIDFIGASLSTSSSGLFASCLTKHQDKVLDIMSDVLFNPTFPEEELDKIRKQYLSALQQEQDDPNAIAGNVRSKLMFGKDHPYGELKSKSSLEAISRADCKNFYDTYFGANQAYLIVVGDIKPKDARAIAKKHFGQWSKKTVKKEQFSAPSNPEHTRVDFVHKDGAVQSIVNIAYAVDLPPGHPDVVPVSMMNTILGGYFGSRLNENLREDKAYTYGARSSISYDELAAKFTAYAAVRNEVTDSSIVQFLYEIEKMRREPVPGKELEMVKNYRSGGFARSLENPQTIARFALNTFRYKLPTTYYATYLEKLADVTEEDILRVAQRYLRPDNAHILVVGNKDEVADKLDRFSYDGSIQYFDTRGDQYIIDDFVKPNGFTSADVINSYLENIGGTAKLKAVKSMTMMAQADLGGTAIEWKENRINGNAFDLSINMMGRTMQRSTYHNGKGMVANGGGPAVAVEGDALEDLRLKTYVFDELNYTANKVTTELIGTDLIDGKQVYKVAATYPSGTKVTQYFDRASGLKVRDVVAIENAPMTLNYADYREVDGVKMPHEMTMSGGGMPMQLTVKVKDYTINPTIDPSVFN